jgi:hypothetical protein
MSHVRNGAAARTRRQEQAKLRQIEYNQMDPEEREIHDVAVRAEWEGKKR